MPPAAQNADESAFHDIVVALYRAVEHPDAWRRWVDEHRDRAAGSTALTQHLNQAESLRRVIDRLRHERAAVKIVLDHIAVPVVLVDRDGAVVMSNGPARRLVADGAGISLMGHAVSAATPELTARLITAIRKVTKDGAERPHAPVTPGRMVDVAMLLPRPSDPMPLHVLIVAISPDDDLQTQDGRVAAALFVGDPRRRSQIDGTRMRHMFSFTATETRVAAGLANGSTVNQLANELELARNTVRWHVKHVLQKSGVKTQAQFVRLIHRSPAGLL